MLISSVSSSLAGAIEPFAGSLPAPEGERVGVGDEVLDVDEEFEAATITAAGIWEVVGDTGT